jgi:hypothetical protein
MAQITFKTLNSKFKSGIYEGMTLKEFLQKGALAYKHLCDLYNSGIKIKLPDECKPLLNKAELAYKFLNSQIYIPDIDNGDFDLVHNYAPNI